MSLATKDYDEAYVGVSDTHEPALRTATRGVEEFCAALKLAVALGEELGASVDAIHDVLREIEAAMERGDATHAMSLSKSRAAELAASSQTFLEIIKGKLVEAKNLHVNVGEQIKLFNKATESMSEGQIHDAFRLMAKCNSMTTPLILGRREAKSVILTTANSLSEAKKSGVRVRSALETLLQAKKAFERFDHDEAIKLARAAQEEAQNLLTLHISAQNMAAESEALREVHSAITATEKITAAARRIGADMAGLDKMIGEAKSAQDAGDMRTARDSYNQCLEQGLVVCRGHVKRLISHASEYADGLKPLGIDDTLVMRALADARAHMDSEDFETAFDLIEKATIEAKTLMTCVAEETLTSSEAGAVEAGKLLAQARRALEDGKFERALQLAKDSVTRLESRERCERDFAKFSREADSTIRDARKFGINAVEAVKTLARAHELKETNISRASEEAEKASQLALERMKALAPKMKVSVDVPSAIVGEPVDGSITIVNEGKSLARNVRIEISGNAEVGGPKEAPDLRAMEKVKIPIKVKMIASGSALLTVQTTACSVDGREHSQETTAQIEVIERSDSPETLHAEKERRCMMCRGFIKTGFRIATCPACGKEFHEVCAQRAGTCPSCQESFPTPT